jgi:hypothetical protein
MGALRAVVCAVAVASSVGCQLYARGSSGVPKTTIRHGEPVTVRTDSLPGAGELLPDGRVRYVVAVTELCQAPKLVDSKIVTTPSITPAGIAFFVGAGTLLAAGVGITAYSVFAQPNVGGSNSDRQKSAVIGVSTLIVGAVLTGFGAARGRKEKAALGTIGEGPVTTKADGTDDVPCKDSAAELGPLELTTPWNTISTATPDANGAVTFDVQWVADALDPDAATADSLIAAPWKVAATKAKISTTWQPLGPQLPQALDLARAAKAKAKKTEKPRD